MLKLVGAGRLALVNFQIGASVVLLLLPSLVLPVFLSTLYNFLYLPLIIVWTILAQYHIYSQYYRRPSGAYQVAVRAAFLGQVVGCGVIWSVEMGPSACPFGNYAIAMAVFHFSEFLVTSIIRPKSLKLDSFLLNHSKEYALAAAASWLEFFLELYLLPSLKELRWIRYLGLLLCLSGEIMRKTAMFTAGSNFNHIVQMRHEEGHQLVTHGVYSLCRHPSYVGWFYWSIGTQLILINPICVMAYALVSWHFFKERIEDEELTLLNFFEQDYIDYMNRVPTGLPLIKGINLDEIEQQQE